MTLDGGSDGLPYLAFRLMGSFLFDALPAAAIEYVISDDTMNFPSINYRLG